MRGFVVTSMLLAVVLAGACARPVPGEPRAAGPPSTAEAPSELPARDRDPAVVAAALDRIDPCALLDLDVSIDRGITGAVTTPDGSRSCTLLPDPDLPVYQGIRLEVGREFGGPSRYSAAIVDVAGTKAYQIMFTDDQCLLAIPVSFEAAVELTFESDLQDPCEVVRAYAEGTVAALRSDPATAALLYGPDDVDVAAIGACVDYGKAGNCRPARDVPAPPPDHPDVLSLGADLDLQCAAFTATVREVFGPSFQPVTVGVHCVYVEPTHTVQLLVNLDPVNPPSSYGTDMSLWDDRQVTTVAGKAAVTLIATTEAPAYHVFVSPTGAIDRPGNIHVSVEVERGRGSLFAVVDPALLRPELADRVAGIVAARYFP